MRLPDGTTEIVLKIVSRWTKNNKDPENSVYYRFDLVFDFG